MSELERDTLESMSVPQLADFGLMTKAYDDMKLKFPQGRDGLEAIAQGEQPTDEQLEAFGGLKEWLHNCGHLPEVSPFVDLLRGTGFLKPFDDAARSALGQQTSSEEFSVSDWPEPTTFLGLPLRFPFGVPSCALKPNSAYLKIFASHGFDLLTYKTVRSGEWRSHPYPNLALVPGLSRPLHADERDEVLLPRLNPQAIDDPRSVSLVNSIGVPAIPRPEWTADVRLTKQALQSGQILIVSVGGAVEKATDDRAVLAQEFADGAVDAIGAGADVVELNFSSPNNHHGMICANADLAGMIVRAVRAATGDDARLLLKISFLERPQLRQLFKATNSWVNGMVAINALPVHARDVGEPDKPFFRGRPDRGDLAGLSGAGIREIGLQTVGSLAELRADAALSPQDWVIVGVGGVLTPEHYGQYRSAGADAVQSFTGAWFNHNLAEEIKTQARRNRRLRRLHGAYDAFLSGGLSLMTEPRDQAAQQT